MHSQINSDEFVGEVNSISFFTVREEFLVSVSKNKTNLPPKKTPKPTKQPHNERLQFSWGFYNPWTALTNPTFSLQVLEIPCYISAGPSFSLTLKEWFKFELLNYCPSVSDASLKNSTLANKKEFQILRYTTPTSLPGNSKQSLLVRKIHILRELNL